jgi:hypothetical protein
MSHADLVQFPESFRVEPARLQPESVAEGWFVYQRQAGRRRGVYLGPFDAPDAAIAHLRDLVELELLLLDAQGRSTSTFRLTRRAASSARSSRA